MRSLAFLPPCTQHTGSQQQKQRWCASRGGIALIAVRSLLKRPPAVLLEFSAEHYDYKKQREPGVGLAWLELVRMLVRGSHLARLEVCAERPVCRRCPCWTPCLCLQAWVHKQSLFNFYVYARKNHRVADLGILVRHR
jgi:hypothetical protein